MSVSWARRRVQQTVNHAVVALNASKQDATKYGYTEDEWNAMVATVTAAKKTLDDMKGEVTVEPGHEHTFSTEWTITETEHYHASTCEHSDEKKDVGPHDTNGADGSCSVCGYKKPAPPEGNKKRGCKNAISVAGTVSIAVVCATICTAGVAIALRKRKGDR